MKRRATIAEVERLLAAERARSVVPADLAARLKADLGAFGGERDAASRGDAPRDAARAEGSSEDPQGARVEERLARAADGAAPPADLAARLKADLAAHVARTRRIAAEGDAAAERNAAAADDRRAARGRGRRAGGRRDSRWSLPLSIAAHAAVLALVAAVGWWLIGDQIFEPPTGTVQVASAAAPRLGEEIPGALHADVLPPQGPAFVETARRPAAAVDLHPPLVAFDAALAALSDGRLPRPSDARPEAFVSAFGADLRAPATTPLEAALDAAPSERDPRLLYVRVRLAARDVDPPRRPPASLAVVLDVGGPGAAERIFVAQCVGSYALSPPASGRPK